MRLGLIIRIAIAVVLAIMIAILVYKIILLFEEEEPGQDEITTAPSTAPKAQGKRHRPFAIPPPSPTSTPQKTRATKAKIKAMGDMEIISISPSSIPAKYKPELTVLTIEGQNFGSLPEVWIGDFRVAADYLVSTESQITIRELRLYGPRLWPKKWTVTVKRSDGQMATTKLSVGFQMPWLLLIVVLVVLLLVFLGWKKLKK